MNKWVSSGGDCAPGQASITTLPLQALSRSASCSLLPRNCLAPSLSFVRSAWQPIQGLLVSPIHDYLLSHLPFQGSCGSCWWLLKQARLFHSPTPWHLPICLELPFYPSSCFFLFFLQDPPQVSSPSGRLPCSTKLRSAQIKLLPGTPLLRASQSSLKLIDLEKTLFSRTPLRQSPGGCPLISNWRCGYWWGVRPSKGKKNGWVWYLLGFYFERQDANVGAELNCSGPRGQAELLIKTGEWCWLKLTLDCVFWGVLVGVH